MSRFVRCDRCDTENAVIGTLSLPPGWQKICEADLCESCSALVREFIRFKASDAAKLPVEPIPQELARPIPDKLFETAPEPPTAMEQIAEKAAAIVNSGALDTPDVKCTASVVPIEVSTEERVRTRHVRRKKALAGQAAILPDKRTDPGPAVQP